MEINERMIKSDLVNAKYCPFCRAEIHNIFADSRCWCEHCGWTFYLLKNENMKEQTDEKDDCG